MHARDSGSVRSFCNYETKILFVLYFVKRVINHF